VVLLAMLLQRWFQGINTKVLVWTYGALVSLCLRLSAGICHLKTPIHRFSTKKSSLETSQYLNSCHLKRVILWRELWLQILRNDCRLWRFKVILGIDSTKEITTILKGSTFRMNSYPLRNLSYDDYLSMGLAIWAKQESRLRKTSIIIWRLHIICCCLNISKKKGE